MREDTNMKRSTRPRPRAFTLLEVLIGLAIFSIGLLALVPLFSVASWGSRGGQQLTGATVLARTYVDKLRNTPFGNIGTGTGCPGACTPPSAEVTANAPYVVSWAITGVDGAAYNFGAPPNPNMKRITVTVTCATCASKRLANPGIQMITIVSERS